MTSLPCARSHWYTLSPLPTRQALGQNCQWFTVSGSALNFSLTYCLLFPSRVEITVPKKRISHSTHPTTETRSYYCVNRLHPSWNSCKGRFSSANSTIAKRRSFHIVCPIKLQCFLMNLQRNIAKNTHTHTQTVLELSLLLLVKTCCNFSLLLCPGMQQNSAFSP